MHENAQNQKNYFSECGVPKFVGFCSAGQFDTLETHTSGSEERRRIKIQDALQRTYTGSEKARAENWRRCKNNCQATGNDRRHNPEKKATAV